MTTIDFRSIMESVRARADEATHKDPTALATSIFLVAAEVARDNGWSDETCHVALAIALKEVDAYRRRS